MSNSNNKPTGWQTSTSKTIPKNSITFKTHTSKVSLNTDAFDDLIKQQGIQVCVYRTMLCSNVKSIDSAEHNIDCTLCNNGFIDRRPIKTWAFFQSQDLEKMALKEGYYDANTLAATFMQGVELQYFTLIELPDHTDIFFEHIKRQQGTTDILKYKAKTVNMLIDSSGREYFVGNDFDIDQNGNIKWRLEKGPLKHDIYSIHYEAAIQFRAIKAMHINRFAQDSLTNKELTTFKKMNEQWLLQKEFLVKRKDLQGNELKLNLIRPPDEDDTT